MNNANIIPALINKTPDYWCTWDTQYQVLQSATRQSELAFDGDQGALSARNMLNEDFLFGKSDLVHQFPEVRRAMFLVLDDGWDVDYDADPSINKCDFGSLKLNKKRFPSFTLKQLCDKVKAEGWRGLGIWICAQQYGERYNLPFEENSESYEYWKQKILMSKKAGVGYWKVDWGKLAGNCEFRKMLTDMAHKLYPKLIIEHASCYSPVNKTLRFCDDTDAAEKFCKTAGFSDVFRTYDVTAQLSLPTTLDRVQYVLRATSGIVNCEDELYIGAVLGCSVGVMRGKFTPKAKLDEVIAAVRWHSVMPAFSGGQITCSEQIKCVDFFFNKDDTWFSPIWNKKISQAAPLIIARNAPLPKVQGDNCPFILFSKSPNGIYCVGAINTGHDNAPSIAFEAERPQYIGVFGWFENLTVTLEEIPRRAYIQSLIRGNAMQIDISKNTLNVSADILNLLYTSIDNSDSAVIIKLDY